MTENDAIHPELVDEQHRLDRAHELLEAMLDRARSAREVSDRIVETENTVDAQVAQYHLRRREEELRAGSGPLCFGRIDTDDRERWYIGRRHVEDAEATPVVVDWRAPVSAGFYRATAVDPCGVDQRRRFSVVEREIVSIFDEDLTDPDTAGASGLPDPLLAELERSRTGQMRDIVSTIAAEQDVIIRAPLDELLVVQGGPGTGKTAVGLHRAAFLLFQHRQELLDSQVLVLGPNPLFLRYIAEVLPSLGETAVRQATLTSLLAAKYRVRATDEPEAARLKGDVRMAAVIEGAIRDRIRVPADGLEVRSGLAVVRFTADELDGLVKTVLSRRLPVNAGKDVLRRMIVAEAWRRYSARAGLDGSSEPTFTAEARTDRGFKAALDKLWPNLSPVALVKGLYGTGRRLAVAAEGILSADEQALLRRKGASKAAEEPWTDGDLPILDEAETRISGVPNRYGHVVVDEAQDLSPMALRLVGRRAEGGSMTVLGDLAQATTPQAIASWDTAVGALTTDHPDVTVRLAELTVGYRLPASILDVANRLLASAAPTVTPAVSVRRGGAPPLVLSVDDDELGSATAAEVAALVVGTTSVAVVAVEAQHQALEAALTEAGLAVDRVGRAGLPGRDAVALVGPLAVKGLEFDAVVVVEPAAIVDGDAGLRHLFVSLTRAVQHLGIVHARPLPPELGLDDTGPR
ncbi:MAG: AAA family ATPase [Actinomycetota bacterium]